MIKRLAHFQARSARAIAALFLAILLCSGATTFAEMGYSGIFGGGPFYINATNNINEIKNSGFTEAIVWNIEVKSNGDLNFNGEFPLVSNGVYIGDQTHPDFATNMSLLKEGTIKRVTFSIGSSNVGDWQDVKALVNSQGTGMDSILYKNFAALKSAIPALDAIDFDDENSFDSASTIAFGVMLGQLGYKVNPDAFNNSSYWQNVVAQINSQAPGTVDGVHLQAYAGGSGNNPCVGWDFGSVPVWPGLWDLFDSPSQVQSIMTGWNNQCGINGGFIWLYDDFVGNGLAAQYASAINNAVTESDFTLSGPSTVYLNQSGTTQENITITPADGFDGEVTLSLSALPAGVQAQIQGQGNRRKIRLKATATAATGLTTVTVTGTSGDIVETFNFTLAVSASSGSVGTGQPIAIGEFFNVYGIYSDGTPYTTGGLDGVGYSYSGNLLGTTRVYNNILFLLGAPDQLSAISCARQNFGANPGAFTKLYFLGTAVQGDQVGRSFSVHYSDNSVTQFPVSFSDWATPHNYPGESEAVAMPYRNFKSGKKDKGLYNLYVYRLDLDPNKQFLSVTLPNDPDIIILSATVAP